ncbi:hypothetical protein TNCV_3596441 [Trichonephila clavipes]|nr:hypothetical protein TNCV_3596441 [Trichonephila clavipes]
MTRTQNSNCPIVRHPCTDSTFTILRQSVSWQRVWLKESCYYGAQYVYFHFHPLTVASVRSGVVLKGVGLQPNRTSTSSATNSDPIWIGKTIVHMWGGPMPLPQLYDGTPLPQLQCRFKLILGQENLVKSSLSPGRPMDKPALHSWCDGMGCHCIRHTVTPNIDPRHHT